MSIGALTPPHSDRSKAHGLQTQKDGSEGVSSELHEERHAVPSEEQHEHVEVGRPDARWHPTVTCYKPTQAWRSREPNANGKRPLVFDKKLGFADLEVKIPCGGCTGCRLDHSKQWAIRIYHESTLHDHNCFITLTYDNEHLPRSGSLSVRSFQLFMKRLRKRYGNGIRVFYCGEYGEQNNRPHYHAILFNHYFPDMVYWQTKNENDLFTSASLSELWPYGFSSVGSVSFQSAAYCGRYIMKKQTGEKSWDHYKVEMTDPRTGEIFMMMREPEFAHGSRNPGIGHDWFHHYNADVFPDDFVVLEGKQMKPPRYYDELLKEHAPAQYALVRAKRKAFAELMADNNTPERLRVRETVKQAQLTQLRRDL